MATRTYGPFPTRRLVRRLDRPVRWWCLLGPLGLRQDSRLVCRGSGATHLDSRPKTAIIIAIKGGRLARRDFGIGDGDFPVDLYRSGAPPGGRQKMAGTPRPEGVKAKIAADKIMKKVGPGLFPDKPPASTSRCLAPVRIYVNRQPGGNWVQCSKNRRPGKRTCFWHKHYEEDET